MLKQEKQSNRGLDFYRKIQKKDEDEQGNVQEGEKEQVEAKRKENLRQMELEAQQAE